MGSVNKVILVGRLGKKPETKPVGETTVANFSVATSQSWKDKQGKKQERTEWHNVTAWGKLAEIAGEYLDKGQEVYIEGRIQTDEVEKDGVKKYYTKVVAENITFLGSKADKSESAEKPSAEEDLPF
jgi:single-strand DNA-binding protein